MSVTWILKQIRTSHFLKILNTQTSDAKKPTYSIVPPSNRQPNKSGEKSMFKQSFQHKVCLEQLLRSLKIPSLRYPRQPLTKLTLLEGKNKQFFKLLNTYTSDVNDAEHLVVPTSICQPNKFRGRSASSSCSDHL